MQLVKVLAVFQHVGGPMRVIDRRVLTVNRFLHLAVDFAIGTQPRELGCSRHRGILQFLKRKRSFDDARIGGSGPRPAFRELHRLEKHIHGQLVPEQRKLGLGNHHADFDLVCAHEAAISALKADIVAECAHEAGAKGVAPTCVSSSDLAVRVKSAWLSSSSNVLIWWLTAEGVTDSVSAVRRKLSCRAATQKVRSPRSDGSRPGFISWFPWAWIEATITTTG